MEDKVMVQNLTANKVVYHDDNGGIGRRYVFNPGQIIPMEREVIERMQYDEGGSVMLREYLSVKDDEMREIIGVPEDEVEYDFTEQDVINLLNNKDVDGIADALDFGPQGIKDLIVDKAVSLPITDRDIMAVISEATGKDIEAMIKNIEIINSDKDSEDNTPKQRRKSQSAAEEPKQRRKSTTTTSGKEIVIPD